MADFPLVGNRTLVETIGFDLATSGGTILTSVGSGDSAWVELVAATSADSDLLELYIMRSSSGNIGVFRLDIGVGGAGAEEVILDDLLYSGKPNNQTSHIPITIPVSIPAGSRIAFRCNFSASNRVAEIAGALYAGEFKTSTQLSSSISYGFNGIDGIDVDPGAVANTKGSWFELDASISDSINGFYLSVGDSSNTAHSDALWLIDIAIGGAGSEVVIAENLPTRSTITEPIKAPLWVDTTITEGSRVAVRAQCTITDATDRLISASITGFK